MKQILLTSFIITLSSVMGFAQDTSTQTRGRAFDPAKRIDRIEQLVKELDLSERQELQVDSLGFIFRPKALQVFEANRLDREALRAELPYVYQSYNKAIYAILSKDQAKDLKLKMQEIRKNRPQRGQGRQ